MATLEEVLAALNSATTNAREVLTKIPQIATSSNDVPFTFADGTQITVPGLQKLKAEVDGFIAGARGEYGGIRITPNQIGILSGGPLPVGWNNGLRSLESGESLQASIAFQFKGGDPNNQPYQAEVDQFYSDLGIPKPEWFAKTINAIEISWNLQSSAAFFMFAGLNLGPAIAHGAFIRRLEGSIQGSWWSGTKDSDLPIGVWKFCGSTIKRGYFNSYVHRFFKLNAGTGKIQIVAPAIVWGGYADVYWNIYPNINGKYDE